MIERTTKSFDNHSRMQHLRLIDVVDPHRFDLITIETKTHLVSRFLVVSDESKLHGLREVEKQVTIFVIRQAVYVDVLTQF